MASIRAKALSRTKISSAVPSTAFFAREVEDQDSGNLTLNHISVEDRFHQPSIRPQHIDHDSSMRTSHPMRDARAPNQHLRSSLRRPGAPAGCSRCERCPDTASACAASSRVVRLICGPRPLWPRLWVLMKAGGDTACAIRDRAAPPPAPLPPAWQRAQHAIALLGDRAQFLPSARTFFSWN